VLKKVIEKMAVEIDNSDFTDDINGLKRELSS
jgi:hypothetical protein